MNIVLENISKNGEIISKKAEVLKIDRMIIVRIFLVLNVKYCTIFFILMTFRLRLFHCLIRFNIETLIILDVLFMLITLKNIRIRVGILLCLILCFFVSFGVEGFKFSPINLIGTNNLV